MNNVLEQELPLVKTNTTNDKIYCTESYAQELYDLMVGNNATPATAKVGNTEKGTVIAINRDEVTLEVPRFKSSVYIALKGKDANLATTLSVGQEIEFLVTEVSNQPYAVAGSVAAFHNVHVNNVITSLHSRKEPLNVFIKEMQAAGYNVTANIDGVEITMFLPHIQAGVNKLVEPEKLVGQNLEVMLVEFSVDNNTYIVSRKRFLETLIPKAIAKLEQGVIYEGKVTGTTAYGIFVEFHGCLTGMIHRANINPEFIQMFTENAIEAGTNIQFLVKEVIKDRNMDKIILTQVHRESLWDTIKIGQKLTGTVRENKAFGTLVQLDEETLGLIHTSELEKLSKPVEKGDKIEVRVLSANRAYRKIFLTVV